MKIFSNSKNFIAMLVLGLMIMVALMFVARPLIGLCLDIYKGNKDKRTELESYDKNIENLISVKAQIEDISYTIDKANNFIPAEENLGDFIVQLEATATKSKISITSIEMDEEKENSSSSTEANTEADKTSESDKSNSDQSDSKVINVSGANETSINVEIEGKYSKIASFLENMKKLSRFNIIKDLSISSEADDNTTASFYVIIFNRG